MQRKIDRLRQAANAYAGSTATSGDARSVDENTSEEATIETAVESLRAVWRGIRAPVEEGSRRYYMPSAAGLL
ncbi:MAG: hypothetical protein J4F38_15690, partial [Pseudomonadales bacterium]|nr:hypothetical protein [Pseudomonadales bacterium]